MKRIFCLFIIIIFGAIVLQAQDSKTGKKAEDAAKDSAKKTAEKAVDKKSSKTAEQYIKDLKAKNDEKTIIEAADFLGKEKEKDAIPGLNKLLEDSREKVRLHAVMALGYIGEKEGTLDGLHKVLINDSNSDVRYAALLATFRIGSEKSLDTWKQVKESETDPFILDFIKKMEEKAKSK